MTWGFQLRSVVLGFFAALSLLAAGVAALFWFGGPSYRTIFHEVRLPSGKILKVTSCNFTWGAEHDLRTLENDSFGLEYVSTVPHSQLESVDRETVEAFELIRPISELWGIKIADVSAFPSEVRKGPYYAYHFTQSADGPWTFVRKPSKVFIND